MFLTKFYNCNIPIEPLDNTPYIKTAYEDLLWSGNVHIPKKLYEGLSYRVREDYYNVEEIYYRKDVELPDLRLVGTDVRIHKVDDTGEFGIIKNVKTGTENKIYHKLLRCLNQGERFSPNPWYYQSGMVFVAPRRVVKPDFEPFVRFELSLHGSQWCISVREASTDRLGKFTIATKRRKSKKLELLLWEGLLSVQEVYGYWNDAEICVYNAIANGTVFELPMVQKCLDYCKAT